LNASEGTPDYTATGYVYYVYASAPGPLVPFYRCIADSTTGYYGVGTHYYALGCGAVGHSEGVMGYVYANSPGCGAVGLAEYVYMGTDNTWKYNRVYTTDPNVGANLVNQYQYTSLGIVGYVWNGP
jgi:hypothetical protein